MFGERYPDLPITETIADHWRELGLARPMPMGGYLGFEWQEIAAYKTLLGCDLSPIEAQTLVDMSKAYASCISDTKPLSIEPMERGND